MSKTAVGYDGQDALHRVPPDNEFYGLIGDSSSPNDPRKVVVPEPVSWLLGTNSVCRLYTITQINPFSEYLGGVNDRFEHSIDVLYLAKTIAERMGFPADEKLKIMAAGLLHDVGQPPVSHVTEKSLGTNHDTQTQRIIADAGYSGFAARTGTSPHQEPSVESESVYQCLLEHGLYPEEIAGLVRGESSLGQILDSEIDADGLAYLTTDLNHTITLGFDVFERFTLPVIRAVRPRTDRLSFSKDAVKRLENYVGWRAALYQNVYFSSHSRYKEALIAEFARIAKNAARRFDEVNSDNHEGWQSLQQRLPLLSNEYFLRMDEFFDSVDMKAAARRLYLLRRAIWEVGCERESLHGLTYWGVIYGEVDAECPREKLESVKKDESASKSLKRALSDAGAREVYIDEWSMKPLKGGGADVDGVPLRDISEVVRALEREYGKNEKLIVVTDAGKPKGYRDAIAEFFCIKADYVKSRQELESTYMVPFKELRGTFSTLASG